MFVNDPVRRKNNATREKSSARLKSSSQQERIGSSRQMEFLKNTMNKVGCGSTAYKKVLHLEMCMETLY